MDPRDRAIEESIRKDQEAREHLSAVQARAAMREARSEIRALRGDLKLSEDRLGVALELDRPPPAPYVRKSNKGVRHRGAFVLLCSDWHVGERVDKAQVGGRNEYNPDIARRRLDKLIDGALWMIETWRSKEGYGWGIDQVVCWLGGDLITGMIHEDLAESNFLSPTEETLLAQEMVRKLIDALASHPGIERVDVPTSWGNHGRDTPDRRVSTAWKRSYEWLLYQMLGRQYAKSRTVAVHTGIDEISRLKVLNTNLRFNHGDQFNYKDGVGGLTIPARKWIARLDKTEPADVTCIGHWHQYKDDGDLVVNNCMIGWGAYAQRVAPFSQPSQVSFLIDEKRGKRMSTEIIVS